MTGSSHTAGPEPARRVAAVGAIAALVAALVFMAFFAAARWEVVVLALVLLGVAVTAGWFAVSRRGTVRLLALVVLGAGGRRGLRSAGQAPRAADEPEVGWREGRALPPGRAVP
jgi:hypothetical protein